MMESMLFTTEEVLQILKRSTLTNGEIDGLMEQAITIKKATDDIKLLSKGIIPKEEPKQEALEEAAERLAPASTKLFIEGAKWQAEKMYSEDEVDKTISDFKHDLMESKSDYIKRISSAAIFGLNRLKHSKKK